MRPFSIRKAAFQDLVRAVATRIVEEEGLRDMEMDMGALAALQEAAELHLVRVFETADMLALHRSHRGTRAVKCQGTPDCRPGTRGTLQCHFCRRDVYDKDSMVVDQTDLGLALRMMAPRGEPRGFVCTRSQ